MQGDHRVDPNHEQAKIFTGTLAQEGAGEVFAFQASSSFEVILEGPTGVDFDLYVRQGIAPTPTSYDRRSTDLGPDETIRLVDPDPGM